MDAELSKSPYHYLLDDPDFRRWFQNVKRGSVATAYEWFRRIGFLHKRFGKGPKEMAIMKPKQAADFLMDVVSALDGEKRSGNYISNCVKPVKSWLEFNGIQVQQRIKIPRDNDLIMVADERPPTPEELRGIFNMADFRARVACSLVAFSGFRLEVLGDYLGDDGLTLKDLPEMVLREGNVEFKQTPTMITIRKSLSKTGNHYLTFLCEEGCEYVKQYLEWRLRRGEKLTPNSPLITPDKLHLAGQHIRTINIGDLIRKPIRAAGYDWRPYVLRRYFDTRMMMAESDGLIIRDYRSFWMGHKGDIEHTYTVNKGLSKDTVEKMRESYDKAAGKYLVTIRKESITKDTVLSTFNEQFLKMAGYGDKEIAELGDLSQLTPQQTQEMIRKKSMQALGLNGNGKQKVVPLAEVRTWVLEGWEFVSTLPTNEAVVRLPSSEIG